MPTVHALTSPNTLPFSTCRYSTVDTLRQQYLFVPAKYKDAYLAYVLTGAWAAGRRHTGSWPRLAA